MAWVILTKSVLVGGVVLLQESSGVVVTDGLVGWALSSNRSGGRSHEKGLADHIVVEGCVCS